MTVPVRHRSRVAISAVVLVVFAFAAGCNNESSTPVPTSLAPGEVTTAPATTSPPTAAPSTTAAPTTAPTTAAPTTAAPTTAAPTTAKPAAEAPAHFTTPSGNIGCMMGEGAVRCDILRASFKKPVDPTCDLDYGDSFAIEARGTKGIVVCHGDTVLGGTKLTSYPARATQGGTVCDIEATGVTCKNPGGHGFFVSAESYRLF